MRVEKVAASPMSATAALPSSASTPQLPPPTTATAPVIPPLLGLNSTASHSTLAQPSAAAPSHAAPAAHSFTAPLPAQPVQKLSYEQLLSSYQQACGERDAFASQLEKLKEKSLALAVDTSASAAALTQIAAASSSPRPHLLSALSPTASASASAALSPSAATSASGASGEANTLQSLRDKHGLIQSTISTIQHKTARILHDQERELIRAFRLRLTTLTAELEAERQRSASGSAEWVSRCKRLSEEMEWTRGLVEQLGEENKGLTKEVKRMRKAMRVQEEDREFLIKQLIGAKRENARLRAAVEKGGGAAGGSGARNGDNGMLLLSASAQDAVAAIREWAEDEEEKTAVS